MKVQHITTLHESSVIDLAPKTSRRRRESGPRKARTATSTLKVDPLVMEAAKAAQRPGTRLVIVSEHVVMIVNR